MANHKEIQLTLNDFTPESIGMARLSQYLKEFAALLGHPDHVHFLQVKEGSCRLAAYSDPVSEPKVEKRLFLVQSNQGPQDARNAYRNIDDMMAEDNTAGYITAGGAKLIDFPGRNRPKQVIIESVRQRECLDGELVSIGGKDETVPVCLRDLRTGKYFRGNTSKEKAREMARYLFGAELRVFGDSEWERDESGYWTLKTIWIEDFKVLKHEAVFETIKRLRAIPGNEWHQYADPQAELMNLRYERSEATHQW